MSHHRLAIRVIAAAAVLDVACGLAFSAAEHVAVSAGLYWSVTTATTVGYGDLTAKTPAGHVISVLAMLTVIPLFGATFSLFTSGLTAGHVSRAEKRIKNHIDVARSDPGAGGDQA